MPRQVNNEHVKQQLRQQQRTWEAEQSPGSGSTCAGLQIWSIGKLLHVVKTSLAAENPQETLNPNGIVRHTVGCVDQHRVASQTKAGDAVTYTSSRVWVTGFLYFGEQVDNCDVLHLCDCKHKLPSLLLDPRPFLVDQLVLVKHWVLVEKALGGVSTSDSVFLEIHDQCPAPLLPVDETDEHWTQEDVLRLLRASYKTIDPPMYSATAKRKRVHAVYGRITSVSSISRQRDCVSSHFFVEVEHPRSSNETQSAVIVMFTGLYSMRWHLFLHPGKTVLLTDLVKVYSRECEVFLLQATHAHPPDHVSKQTGKTIVHLWEAPASSCDVMSEWIDDSLKSCSMDHALRCSGKLLDYEGKVVRLVWDECIELEGLSGTRVVVSLFHFPLEQELVRLRKGARVRVCGAHVLRWPTPAGGRLMIGLCPRSHFAVVTFGDPSGPCITPDTVSHRNRTNKKWSYLGDVHAQSAVLSMWLLELLEVMDKKFFFGEVKQAHFRSPSLSFPHTRRRQAVAQVARKMGFLRGDGRNRAAMTLSAFFLKCHAANADNCISLSLPRRERMLTWTKAFTILELQSFVESNLDHITNAGSGGFEKFGERRSVHMSAKDLDWCLLLACIRGSIDNGDLEVYDRTASISMILDCSEKGLEFVGGRGMYLIRNFDIMVDYADPFDEVQLPVVLCLQCSVADVVFVSMSKDEHVSTSLEEKATRDAQESQEVVFLVSHVDALPRSCIRSAGSLPEYRVFHGIACPVGDGLQPDRFMKSVCTANILVSSQSSHWYIQKGGCYRVRAHEVVKSGGGPRVPSHYSIEDSAVDVSIDYWEKVAEAEDDKLLCFDSLSRLHCRRNGTLMNGGRHFRVYQADSHPIVPVRLECHTFEWARCKLHDICQQAHIDDSGLVVACANDGACYTKVAGTVEARHLIRRVPIEATASEIMAMSALRYFLEQSEEVVQVSSLLQQPLISPPQRFVGAFSVGEQSVAMILDPNLHKPHLVSVIGMITTKKYYWRSSAQHQPLASGVPSTVEGVWKRDSNVARDLSRRLMCVLSIRDLHHLDTVDVRADTSLFGLLGTLQQGAVVELSRLHGFIARASYKVFLKWSHSTAARRLVTTSDCLPVPCSAELFGSLRTTFINDLYYASTIDQTLYRYVVGVMHISYVLLKRKCRLCHQVMQLDKRRGRWKHEEPQVESQSSGDCAWRWKQMSPSDLMMRARTYMGTTVRCIIDDGSGQAELFLEDDVAWELLTCSDGQRRRFDDIVQNYVDRLSYFSGRSATASFATSKAEREQEYYQNELRAFVVDAMPSLRSIVVVARQFFSAKQKENTSVLTFGKDVHITTSTVTLPKLEAKRVDRVHVRDELRRRLAQLQLQLSCASSD
ncbi:unnamed protein product [Hyaloperonospora brassicae]|uniref:CST complex subunit CTC1 n=1 Tax=Hyaloperonospora brassicae TaxID=162125 RepID=A0AAV0UBY5_HYABA|nr:unnamed protein product [Hyaloperonospora brassicae]